MCLAHVLTSYPINISHVKISTGDHEKNFTTVGKTKADAGDFIASRKYNHCI